MNAIMTWPDERFAAAGGDFVPDYRRRRELEESERAELKRVDVEAQSSPSTPLICGFGPGRRCIS